MKQVIYFGAEWCGPCKSIKPQLIAANLPIRYVDVDKSPQMAGDYLVKSIPTVVLVLNGEVAKRVIGTAITPDVVKQMLN
jgi:thioredoxin-like negative regulator of GroEL